MTTADQWRMPDERWACIEPLLPQAKSHPLGCHNPRVDNRRAMDAIVFVLRTGCQWNALNATGLCSNSSAHRRFQEWTAAGVFGQLWARGPAVYDELAGLDWEWLAMDGALTTAPLGGGNNRPQSHRPGHARHQAQPAHRGHRHPHRAGGGRGEPHRLQAGAGNAGEPPHRAPGAHVRRAARIVPR
jgi:transposase